jgi:DNA polymerase I-like protein with 3'-5' exonuclease and polymerase domains
VNFRHLTSEGEVQALIDWHNANSARVYLDVETTSKIAREAKLLDIQMSGREPDEAVLFSGEFLPLIRHISATCVWWNMKYDLTVAYLHGVDLRCLKNRDAMLLHHLVDENADHDLDSIVQAEWGDDYKERFWNEFDSYESAPFERRIDYACRDIVYTARADQRITEALKTDGIPDSLCEHVHRLALALLDTELKGIRVDLDFTIQMGQELKADIVRTEDEMRRIGGFHCDMIEMQLWGKELDKRKTEKGKANVAKPEFNFSSPKQLTQLLYDELELPLKTKWDKKSRTEKPTTEDDALEELEHLHPIIAPLRSYKKMQKMYGSFIEGVMEKVRGDMLYPGFNVNGTVTGRISHSEPNMGQMPSRGEWSKIRGIFVPSTPEHKLITCDYGQLEVVIAAHYSQDKNLLKIIHEGASKHDITSTEVKCERALAKTLNFAMQYQCQPPKVAEIFGCSLKEAQYIWNKYWETYEGEKRVIDECAAKVDRGEAIVNPFGRKRHFPKEFKGPWDRAKAHRQAYSSLIQGTGSDITSTAFYRISEHLQSEGLGRGWFTVHDEVLAQALLRYVEQVREYIQKTMLEIGPEIGLTVPLTVDCSEGLDRWQK